MPILRHAKKKLRADRRRTLVNKIIRTRVKKAVKEVRKSASEGGLAEVFSRLDRAAKKGIVHRRKADRLKSRLARLVNSGQRTADSKRKKQARKVAKKK